MPLQKSISDNLFYKIPNYSHGSKSIAPNNKEPIESILT